MKPKDIINKNNLYDFASENRLLIFFAISLFAKTIILNLICGILFFQPATLRPIVIALLSSFALFSLITFFRGKWKIAIALFVSLFLSILAIGDAVYSRYFHDFPSVGLIGGAAQINDVLPAIVSLFSFWFLLFFLDVAFVLFFKKRFFNITSKINNRQNIIYSFVTCIILFSLLAMAFFIDRNGFFLRAINNSYANRITTEKYGYFTAHLIDIYRMTFQEFKKISPEEKQETINYFQKNKYRPQKNEFTAIAKGKNVILIQVESLTNEVVGKSIEGQEITPNINKFLAKSHYFENHFFEMGGGSTSDTDFTINSSLYPIANESVFVKYGKRDFMGMPYELKKIGYSTYAYHGYYAGFWNRQVALASLGYERFYAAESYPESYQINMGLNDEVFLTKTLEYIKNQPKPFLSYVITLSSHHPFWLEKERRLLNLDESRYPGNVHGYFQNIRYTDEQIGRFLEGLKKEGLYDDSVIVIYGDHNPHVDAFKSEKDRIDTTAHDFREVPMLIKLPQQKNGIKHASITSHIDLAPTITNLLGIKPESPMLGRDMFGETESFFGALWFFDRETIYKGDLLYRQFDDYSEVCGKKTGENYKQVEVSQCFGLVAIKDALVENSKKMIRYNLFMDLKK